MKKIIIILGLGLVICAGLGSYFYLTSMTTSVADAPTFEVQNSDLLVTVVEGGSVQAVREVIITNNVNGSVQIINMVPEASNVKKGDLIVELDSSSIEDQLVSRKLSYQSALNSVTQAKESMEITKDANASQIRDAELAVEARKMDEKKYMNGTWPLQKKQQEAAITIAKAELSTSNDRLEWTRKLHEKGYATRSELETDQLNVQRKTLNLEEQEEQLKIMIKYNHPQQIIELKAEVEKAIQNLTRVKRKAISDERKQQSSIDEANEHYNIQKKKLQQIEEQLKFTKIYAPSDGMVSYVRGERGQILKEGEMIRERQSIMKISDIANMRVNLKVHESRVSQLKLNQIAYVTVDSLPNRRFRGRVRSISRAPDRQSWMNPDLKVYSTDIYLDEALPEGYNYPGLSARAEIVINKMENVINVPIQAVASHENKQVVLIVDAAGNTSLKEVSVGVYNDTNVEIREGLEAGEVVSLSPPNLAEAESLGLSIVNSGEIKKEEIVKAEEEGKGMSNAQTEFTDTAKPGSGDEDSGSSRKRRRRR